MIKFSPWNMSQRRLKQMKQSVEKVEEGQMWEDAVEVESHLIRPIMTKFLVLSLATKAGKNLAICTRMSTQLQ